MNLPVEVVEAINERRCVLIAGSRFSAEAAEAQERHFPEDKALATLLGWKRKKQIMGTVRSRKVPPAPSITEGSEKYEAARGRDGLIATMKMQIGLQDAPFTAAHATAVTRFPLIMTTNYDSLFEQASEQASVGHDVRYRGDVVPAPNSSESVLYKLRGGFEKPESLIFSSSDRKAHAFNADNQKQIRQVIRKQVLLFVGYKPDEEEFELLWEDLSLCYGGELPRCHLAVAQGRINDYLWQKWVWRGLLMFTADPMECMREVEQRTE